MQKNTVLFIFSLIVSLLLNIITGEIVFTFLLEFLVGGGMKFINSHFSGLYPEIMIGIVSGIPITLILFYLCTRMKIYEYKSIYVLIFSAMLLTFTFSTYLFIIFYDIILFIIFKKS